MGSVSGRKRRAPREINGNDPSDTAVDDEATEEGLIAEVPIDPREVGADVVVLPIQTSDEFLFYCPFSFCVSKMIRYLNIFYITLIKQCMFSLEGKDPGEVNSCR